eukprot:CAMPEP_0194156566 /NCGR_PEP_ID=MMETSP0152-20130528/68852_1 /TAXON_ID=1049557 /ORGANISM="Thalassiothrix antarctica, Strain L6-D1" /LENGTH=174 /DNA_ID=CAMNT_0038864351 /DNA_START=168 /DNA_END=692 /DNA_ORIENTATION=+
MDVTDDFPQQQLKRRRFETVTSSPFATQYISAASTSSLNISKNLTTGIGNKRNRSENGVINLDVDSYVIEEQASEIQKLKAENTKLNTSFNTLKTENAKAVHENIFLKRLVTKQHERTTQTQTELEAARKYKNEADDRMSKMEQLILQLRYHLQAQGQSNPINIIGFHQPPDVY